MFKITSEYRKNTHNLTSKSGQLLTTCIYLETVTSCMIHKTTCVWVNVPRGEIIIKNIKRLSPATLSTLPYNIVYMTHRMCMKSSIHHCLSVMFQIRQKHSFWGEYLPPHSTSFPSQLPEEYGRLAGHKESLFSTVRYEKPVTFMEERDHRLKTHTTINNIQWSLSVSLKCMWIYLESFMWDFGGEGEWGWLSILCTF